MRSIRTATFAAACAFALSISASAASQPNVVVILVDDLGWSDLGCYGGEISTPNVDALAATGMRFRQYYVTPRCSPTRASLMTGLYTQQVADNPGAGLPSLVNTNNMTIAEVLRQNGYRTYHVGKWNLGTGALLPENRGFMHTFRFGNGSAHSLDNYTQSLYTLVSQNNEVAARDYGSNFYQTDAIGDYAVDFLDNDATVGGNAPFFLFIAFGAPHFPIQAPGALADTYMSTYAKGWDVIRQERYDRQLADGVIDSRYPFPPRGGTAPHDAEPIEDIPAWDSLDADRKADLARRMALYAAMVQKMDENVGKVVTRLQQLGKLDDTLIFFMSDNGADHEFGKFGTWTGSATGAPRTGAALTNMGQPGAGAIYIGGGWAHVSSTPLRLFKHHTHEGGIRAPLIVHWPAGFSAQNAWTDEHGDVMDILPTILDVTGAAYPSTYNGHANLPLEGTSLLPVLQGGSLATRSLFNEHESNRMMQRGTWKFVTKNFAFSDGSSPANEKELYDLSADPGESNNVASSHPELVASMVDDWNAWAARVGVPAARLIAPPPVNRTPAATAGDLFLDTFNRPDSANVDVSAAGMSGSRVPPIGANTAWFEGYQSDAQNDSLLTVQDFVMQKSGAGMIENGVNHNFVGQDILDAGGFSVSMDVLSINSDATDTANRYAGFAVGLNAAQAAAGNDFAATGSPRPFRGSTTNPGVADGFVELDLNKNVKVWTGGTLRATIPVGAASGTLTAAFECASFAAGAPVTVSVYFDGRRLDLSPSTAADTLTFNWNEASANYVGVSARASNSMQIDNFAVRKLPLADALTLQYASRGGLDSGDTAPQADADADARSNRDEFAFGTDPAVADADVASPVLTLGGPSDSLTFSQPRLADYANVGLNYTYEISENLATWTAVTPTELSATPISGKTGYETVQMSIPDSSPSAHDRLFLRIGAAN